jgi:CxC5 like cysteine cluster associated with KDZ transposases/CxC6 like cysteine cluster associated with KDZ transposases
MLHFCNLSLLWWILLALSILPTAAASSDFRPFPEMSFISFSQFIQQNFSAEISLSTVLSLLFTMTENPELLSLHGRQQYSLVKGENVSSINSWIRSLSQAVHAKVNTIQSEWLHKSDYYEGISDSQMVSNIAIRLDKLAHHLNLISYNKKGHLKNALKPISHKAIEAVHVICPQSYQCLTSGCGFRSLTQATKQRDIPLVTLIKNNISYEKVPVLTGKCPNCTTLYSADHERSPIIDEDQQFTNLYLNSAKYVKVGQSIWVDQVFSNAVINAMYTFHASASGYKEFWNNSFGKMQPSSSFCLSRCQIWQAFVQESIRTVPSVAKIELTVHDNLGIDEVTKEAFSVLGENGVIRAADQYTCSECTHDYIERTSSSITTAANSADIVGIDDDAEQSANSDSSSESTSENAMNVEKAPVKMVVVDGICIGPKHCAYPNCADDLENNHTAVFCAIHEQRHGGKCHVHDCDTDKIKGTQACQQHQQQWKKHVSQNKRQYASGF